MLTFRCVLRDPCGGSLKEQLSLDQLKRESPADAETIEKMLVAGKNFHVSSSRGESFTVYAN